jgi:hypothetical protein
MTPLADRVRASVEHGGGGVERAIFGDERRVAAATALHALAYSARCEHSVAHGHDGPATGRLRADGDLLLRSA